MTTACFQCGGVTADLLCPECRWPRDELLGQQWHRLESDFPDDSKALRTACRGALMRLAGYNETADVACFKAFSKHRTKPGVTLGRVRHRVFVVIGKTRAFRASARKNAAARTSQGRTHPTAPPAPSSPSVSSSEVRSFFQDLAEKLDDDDRNDES